MAKLILVDQMPFITANPAWSEAEKEAAGAILDAQGLYDLVAWSAAVSLTVGAVFETPVPGARLKGAAGHVGYVTGSWKRPGMIAKNSRPGAGEKM